MSCFSESQATKRSRSGNIYILMAKNHRKKEKKGREGGRKEGREGERERGREGEREGGKEEM